MNWSSYEIFSVISGVVLVAAAFVLPGVSVKDRLGMGAGGAFLAGYGFYVANQTTGTYDFPVVIFIAPFLAIGYGLVKAYEAKAKKN